MAQTIAKSSREKDTYVYFLYSEEQDNDRTTLEKSMNRHFVPGMVIVNGKRKRFTEISRNPTNKYPDVKVVAEGYRSQMKYTDIHVQ